MLSRSKYIKQLEDLETYLQRLTDKTVSDIRAVGMSLSGDQGAAEGVLQGTKAGRRLRSAIEDGCLDVMLLQQPLVADDLRFVTGVFRIVSDLAHIEEMTRDIAFLSQQIPHGVVKKLEEPLVQAVDEVSSMTELSVGAFVQSDVEMAHRVFAADDKVDELYDQAEHIIVGLIRKEQAKARHLPELLMVAKYFERMGDDTQRIAGWAVFRATGKHEVYSKEIGESTLPQPSDSSKE